MFPRNVCSLSCFMVFLKEVLFAPDTTRLSLEVRVRRVWLVRLQIRKQFWLRQTRAKVAAGNQRALWRTRVGGRRDRQAWVLGRVQRPRKGGACGWAWGVSRPRRGAFEGGDCDLRGRDEEARVGSQRPQMRVSDPCGSRCRGPGR